MGTNCAPLVADLFLFCYERDFMTPLSDVKQAEIIEVFKSTSRYLDDLFTIDNPYFEGMVNRIYPPELQLNKANTSDTEVPSLDLFSSISNGFVSSKIYDKRDDFDFDIYWSKVLTDQQGLCRVFRKHKIANNLKTATIKQVIIHLSNLLKYFFQKTSLCNFFGQKWKVPYPNTRLQFHNCWLSRVLDIQDHTFFHWFWMERFASL